MKPEILAKWAAGFALLALSIGSPALAQTVTFSDINDAVAGRFYDAATTAPDPLNPNKLIIGFNSGIDPKTWINKAFTASTAAFNSKSAMDTISFRIHAPDGYYISKITYSQRGTGSISRTGSAAGGTHWVIDDAAEGIGGFGTNPTFSRAIDLTGQHKTFIPVSITNAMIVFSTPQLGSASLSVTGADVLVELLPLP